MVRVLVTGGTGFIGRCLTGRLLDQGHIVRRLLRRDLEDEFSNRAESAFGSLSNTASIAAALEGVDAVINLAGRTLAFRRLDYFETNGAGVAKLAEQCARRSTPPTLIHVSSLSAAGPSRPNQPSDERAIPKPVSAYGQSKLAGEEAVRAVADRVPATIVRPPGVIGPWDRYGFRLVAVARRGVLIQAGRGLIQLSFVFVDDLCETLIRAMSQAERLVDASVAGPERDKGVYFVAFEPAIELGEFARLAGRLQGVEKVRLAHVPKPIARIGVAAQELIARIRGRQTMINLDKFREMIAGCWTCSSAKARAQGLFETPRDLEDRLKETIDWYREKGWLDRWELPD